ncbi:aldehyde dehydrogenase family protein [Specibacter cremeus]|uniref:aldehyde dehydrogenase family protein n=1 Tax=Specibacter cremeus TaxID=1629051 RepID=UPI000F7844B7|nr:aldehyde dehydrogenase family protein [Specibacter cremeus]
MNRWDLGEAEGRIYSGGWREGGGGVLEVTSPGDGGTIGRIGIADGHDVERAGALAAEAQVVWGRAPYRERADVLTRAAAVLRETRADLELVLVRESGSLPTKAAHEVDKAIDELIAAASLVTLSQGDILPVEDPSVLGLARRVPVGVVGVIAPWNAPLMLAMRSVAPAIALGNAVIVKPDVKTAFSGGAVIAEIFERAGLPRDLLHILPGGPDTGEALVSSPHTSVIAFTGSTVAGKRVGEVAGGLMKRVILELGGNNAAIVMRDADLDVAVANGVAGSFRHQGQICMATGRHLVHESVADEYVARLGAAAAKMRVGDPLGEGVTLGPLINQTQAERVQRIVDDAVAGGARIVQGGTHDGAFYQPTVLEGVDAGNVAFQQEIFGPVAPVTRFATEEEALELAHESAYGLSASIHSRDISRALGFASRLRAGMVALNGQTIYDAAHIPMGGLGASGNGGRHGGHWNLDEFTFWQWVTVPSSAG